MTGIIALLTGLALYAEAPSLIMPGVFGICAVWSAWFLFGTGKGKGSRGRALVLIFSGYAVWFVSLTGGFYSPGILLIFFIPLAGAVDSGWPWFVLYNIIVLSALAFFYFVPPPGPAAFNLNEHRFLFFVIMSFTFGSGVFLIMDQG